MRPLFRALIGLASLVLLSGPAIPAPFAYIGSISANQITVIDTETNTIAARVALPDYNTSGIAVNSAGTRVYAANSQHLFVIDTTTNAVVATVTVGTGLGGYAGVAVNPAGTRVYVTSNWDQTPDAVKVIDTATNTVVATIPVGDTPVGVAVNPAGTRAYVTNFLSQDVSVIDTASNTVISHIDLTLGGPCGHSPVPFGVAVNPAGTRVYVANQNCMDPFGTFYTSVIDATTNTVLAHVASGTSPSPRGVAVSSDGTRAYVSNGAVIDTTTNKMIATFPGASLNGIALNSDGTRAYVPVFSYGSGGYVSVIDTTTRTVVAAVNAVGGAFALGQFVGPAVVPRAANYGGMWWGAPAGMESGWGINFAHQGDTIFATWFTFGLDGKPWWLVVAANKTAPNIYTGDLYTGTGPPFNSMPFDPGLVAKNKVGTATFTFADSRHATFAYTVNGVAQTKQITLEEFSSPVPTCTWSTQANLTGATNFQDMWWAAPAGIESGWGINMAHQGDTIFATWFTFGFDGKPLWLVMGALKTAPNVYSGSLFTGTGPPFNASVFDRAQVVPVEAGAATLSFADGSHASFAYTLNGVSQTKTLTREIFGPSGSGTVCGEPYRALTPFTIVVAADIGQCLDASAAASGPAKTAALVTSEDALVLTAGDNTYDYGTPAEFANCFDPTWGAFKNRIFPTIGNHEYLTPGAEGYFGYFGAQAGADRRGYYSFDYGGWHFISLNSSVGVTPQSEQYLWLITDLAKSKGSLCTIALVHYPLFNSGATYGSVPEMRPFFDALYHAGVEMVFSGHDHLYERFAPQRADGTADPAGGVRQFVIGTGGHTLNPFGTPLPNSEFRYNESWGVLRLTLGQGKYSWQFVPAGGGAPIDAGSGNCH